MSTEVIDRGRGPEIAGTRITVYDIVDYADWPVADVADLFRLSSEQVEAARRYVEEHRDEVMTAYQEILARNSQGHPPDLQARLDAQHAVFLDLLKQRSQATAQEASSAGANGRQQR